MDIDNPTQRARTLLVTLATGTLVLGAAVPAAAGGSTPLIERDDPGDRDGGILGLGDEQQDGQDEGILSILGFGDGEEGRQDGDLLGLGGDSEAELEALNRSGDAGHARIVAHEDDRTVSVQVSTEDASPGLPHAQHIHIGGDNVCPGPSADTDGDGLIDTAEGQPAYGPIAVSLTTEGDVSADSALAVDRFPVADEDGTVDYTRSFRLPQGVSVEDVTQRGVIVQHGISELFADRAAYDGSPRASVNPDLPLEAVVPSSCGEVTGQDSLLGLDILGLLGLDILGEDHEGHDEGRDEGGILDLGGDEESHQRRDEDGLGILDTEDEGHTEGDEGGILGTEDKRRDHDGILDGILDSDEDPNARAHGDAGASAQADEDPRAGAGADARAREQHDDESLLGL